ncbi:MAG: Kazal-type serine protease inhibitor [Candidatus Micrarchaeota archaeon]
MRTFLAFGLILILGLYGCIGQSCPSTGDPVCGEDGITYTNACLATQAGTEVKSKGACEVNLCEDSDGGKDLFTQGTASARAGSLQDRCKDALTVTEAYCSANAAASEDISCPSGYACTAGACIRAPCQDSDNGKDEKVKGTVTSPGTTQSDECSGSYSVKEYYCSNNEAKSEDIDCGEGMQCVSGACIEAACLDSDGGKDAAKSGTVTKAGDSFEDICSGSSAVKEYFCDGKTVESEIVDCQTGFTCKDDKCVKEICLDSDGGKDIAEKGTATFQNKTGTDSCYSSTAVLEYFCYSETSMQYEKINCGTGKECFDGKCQTVQCAENLTDIDDTDERYNIASYDDADELVLRVGEIVEINDEFMVKLYSVSGNTSTFRMYENYAALKDNDHLCSFSLDAGEDDNDFCSENTETIEVLDVNDSDDFAELSIGEYHAVQYYDQEGSVSDWTNNPICPDDETVYDLFKAEFYPHLDTSTSGLDLESKKFEIFDTTAKIIEVTSDTVTIELDGEEYELESGDEFSYLGQDYEATLTFNDGGLIKFNAEPT